MLMLCHSEHTVSLVFLCTFICSLNANIVIQFYEGVLEPIKGIKRLRI